MSEAIAFGKDELREWAPLLYGVAKSYYRGFWDVVTFEECHALAVEGLWDALSTFDESRGTTLGSWVFRLAKHKLNKHLAQYWSRDRRRDGRRHLSLNSFQDDGSESIGIQITDTESRDPLGGLEAHRADETISLALCALSPREREVVRMYHFEGMTLLEAGKRIGVSRERARQIEAEAIGKMRRFLGVYDVVNTNDTEPPKPTTCRCGNQISGLRAMHGRKFCSARCKNVKDRKSA